MNLAVARHGRRRLWYYLGALALIAIVVAYQHFMQSRTQIYGLSIEQLSPLQEKQLQAFLSMNQLLIALGTGLLGAMGFLIGDRLKGRRAVRESWVVVASAAFVGLSLYFGYKSYDDLLFMLQPPNPTFDLYGALILGDRMAHFATLMIGAFLFADFVFHVISAED